MTVEDSREPTLEPDVTESVLFEMQAERKRTVTGLEDNRIDADSAEEELAKALNVCDSYEMTK